MGNTTMTEVFGVENILFEEYPAIDSNSTSFEKTKEYEVDSDESDWMHFYIRQPISDRTGLIINEDKFYTRKSNRVKKELVIDDNPFYVGVQNDSDSGLNITKTQNIYLKAAIRGLNKLVYLDKDYFESENINLPNIEVRNDTTYLLYLLAPNNIFPSKIESSVEEGVCLQFRKNNIILYVELYNDNEMGYIIEDRINKKVLKNEDVISLIKFSQIIKEFYS